MLAQARAFFAQRSIMEVDTPLLSHFSPLDAHIDVMSVAVSAQETGYLQTSPEYAMKRLLAAGSGDIYQLSHVFRAGEIGTWHNPEFTMVEWYRTQGSFDDLQRETLSFIHLFLGPLPSSTTTYRASFHKYTGIDYVKTSHEALVSSAREHIPSLSPQAHLWDEATLRHCLWSFIVEPNLGNDEISLIADFPASEAALARLETKEGVRVAKRFEAYYQGIELANGYHELSNASEQKERFEITLKMRSQNGKPPLPMDPLFLKALDTLPNCYGVAVGFDRLMQLRHKTPTLGAILPFDWNEI